MATERPTILVFLYHFSHISDLLQTPWIVEAGKKFRVIVCLPPERLSTFVPAVQSENVVYESFTVQNYRLLGIAKLFRVSTIRTYDHFFTFQFFYDNLFHNSRRRFLRFISRPLARFLTIDFFTALEKFFFKENTEFAQLVQKYSPQLVVTATPGFTPYEAEVIVQAKKHRLKTVSLNFSWDNLTSNSTQMRKPDYLICWNPIMQEEAERWYGYTKDNTFVSGIPRFDYYFSSDGEINREKFLQGKNLDPKQQVVLITTVPPTTFPYQKQIIEEILKIRREENLNFNVLIRVHPIDHFSLYQEFLDLPGVHVERAGKQKLADEASGQKVEMDKEDLLNLKHTLQYADVVVNYASTISLEACIFDVPIVNVGYDEVYNQAYRFTHYEPLIQAKAVRVAWTPAEVKEHLLAYLAHPELDRVARKHICDRFIGFTDGQSYKRSVLAVQNIINS